MCGSQLLAGKQGGRIIQTYKSLASHLAWKGRQIIREFERRELGLSVPEDRQSHQRDGDDPQNDVFAAVFFFFLGHKSQYSIPQNPAQVSC